MSDSEALRSSLFQMAQQCALQGAMIRANQKLLAVLLQRCGGDAVVTEADMDAVDLQRVQFSELVRSEQGGLTSARIRYLSDGEVVDGFLTETLGTEPTFVEEPAIIETPEV